MKYLFSLIEGLGFCMGSMFFFKMNVHSNADVLFFIGIICAILGVFRLLQVIVTWLNDFTKFLE